MSLSVRSVPAAPQPLRDAVTADRAIEDPPDIQQAFQDFVAGTFYRQMLQALRKTQNKPAYFHGGLAEDIFQGYFDQTVAEQLARDHGAALAGPLFAAFAQRLHHKVNASQKGTHFGHGDVTRPVRLPDTG
ncbi:MAG TPA: hypothetical protein EYP14_03420 [Planctomycetaceae bacterium]|nr:hypothetical protein [Planctomycetaceae bacterium]